MDTLRERCHEGAPTLVATAHSLDEAFGVHFGDGEHDDVVWDDDSEYECLHEGWGDEERREHQSFSREGNLHARNTISVGTASFTSEAGSPISSSTATPGEGMDNASASSHSPRASSLLSAEGITQADDARLAALLDHCLRSHPSGRLAEADHDLNEGMYYGDGVIDNDGDAEYEDDYEDEIEEEEPEEGEIQPAPAPSQWQLPVQHNSTSLPPPSSGSSSPFPSASSESSYRQPTQKQQQSQHFSMDEFMRGAICTNTKKRSTLQPVISPSRVVQMTNRFRLHEERRARRLAAKRRDSETQQRLGFSYAPSINGNSRRLTRHAPAFLERQRSFQARKQQHVQYETAKQHQVHDRALELQASVRTPCICSRGAAVANADGESNSTHATIPTNPPRFDAGGLRSPVASPTNSTASGTIKDGPVSPGSGHSQACQRFMAICEKMNASFAIQRKKDRMRRSVDDMLAFQREKQQRQQERAAQVLAMETQEETFAPRINPQSERVRVS
jgi:hypothetical protein